MCWGSYRLSTCRRLSQRLDPLLGEGHRLGLLVDDVVPDGLGLDLRELPLHDGGRPLEPGDDAIDPIVEVGRFLGWPGDDERGTRLVDEDGVHLVDDGVVQLALDRPPPG